MLFWKKIWAERIIQYYFYAFEGKKTKYVSCQKQRSISVAFLNKQYFFYIFSIKVHIFWEGHKILRNLRLTFDWHYKSKMEISQIFLAFSEYMNFMEGLLVDQAKSEGGNCPPESTGPVFLSNRYCIKLFSEVEFT